jgi:hypothetical protein
MNLKVVSASEITGAQRLEITTRTGAQFALVERNGALYITAPARMFVQWDGNRACEVFQIQRVEEGECPHESPPPA